MSFKPKRPTSNAQEQELMARLWSDDIKLNPLNFVLFAFPWGQEGTPLAHHKGPRGWQRDELQAIALHIQENVAKTQIGLPPTIYRSATASGRGIGKSSLTAWLILWFESCILGGTAIVTANTEQQLKSRTWAELGKWHTLAINSHWFERSALSLKPAPWFEEALKTSLKLDTGYYYAQAQLWSEENPDAFAGVHNHNGVLLLMDEASGVPESIWTVADGFFTEPIIHRYQFAFSNPRRNTGAFYECFHKYRNLWNRRNLDSRTVEGVDASALEQIILKHGEDSDPVRIEVKGEFPRQGDNQFISREIVDAAVLREVEPDEFAPLYMGVDPARYGDDSTVIYFRQGRNGKLMPPLKLKGKDNMFIANKCAELINKYNPDAVCIDAGNGTGVIDRLRELKYKVHEVWFGSSSSQDEWANKRTEMWADMRDWLKGASIPNDSELIDDLVGPQYKFMGRSDRLMLESKEEMKKRGLSSPDCADALACTFAVKVARLDLKRRQNSLTRQNNTARDVDYKIF